MCGIAGLLWRDGAPLDPAVLKAMCDIQAHRGPDDAGYLYCSAGATSPPLAITEQRYSYLSPQLPNWEEAKTQQRLKGERFRIALGHRRLSILDLSGAGHQPMATPDGRFWIVYNGEIYNSPAIRAKLEGKGIAFTSRSDTEVLLRAWEVEGPAILAGLDGMFAFALYDAKMGTLTLARDRFGVKPLYYSITHDRLIFASEIKALWIDGAQRAEFDPGTLAEYLTLQNVLGCATIYRNVTLLPPGSYREFTVAGRVGPVRSYYRCYDRAAAAPPEGEFESNKTELRHRFEKAVRRQLLSDVPVGSYLSGGMDSGSIVSVGASTLSHLKTFTLGMSLKGVQGMESLFDERNQAERISDQFETEHYSSVLRPWDLPVLIEKLTWHLDDPRVGMSYQNFHIARLAGRMVKVCLSGTGGDELFGGYVWRYAHGVFQQSVELFDEAYFRYWHRLLPPGQFNGCFGAAIQHEHGGVRDRFHESIAKGPGLTDSLSTEESLLHRAMAFEFNFFLQGLLIVEDRVSMANSLETRVPFLDNELAEFAFRLRPGWKVQLTQATGGIATDAAAQMGGKWIFREAMKPLLPDWFIKEPKRGFSTPEANWYRGPLLNYLREILLDSRSRQRWYLQPGALARILKEHEEGQQNHRLLLWSLLSLEWLHRHFIDRSVSALPAA